MSTLNIFQVSLEIWGIALSLILAISSSATVYRASKVLKNTWTMLLLNCMFLSCDALAYVYRGDPTSVGMAMTRFSNFGMFLIEGILAWWFTCVVQQIITGKNKISMKSVPMVIMLVSVIVQLMGTILTPFTNFYYSFDAQNYYVRGSGIIVSFVLLGIVLAINVFEIIKNKRHLSERIWCAFVSIAIMIALSMVIQFAFYGISLINIVITLAVIILYVNLLTDSREQDFRRHISGMEDIIKEINSHKIKEDAQ